MSAQTLRKAPTIARLWDRWNASRVRAGIVLLIILALAAALRFYGIGWGLPDAGHPDSYHPDENALLGRSHWLVLGKIIPLQFIFGGTLHHSILNACIHFSELLSPYLQGINPLANAILAGRYFSTGISLFTIVLLYAAGQRLFGTVTGLFAALLLAISPVHAALVQTVRPDSTATFMAVLLLFLSARILRGSLATDRSHFIFVGLALGAAIALRFPLAAFALTPLAAYVLRKAPDDSRALVSSSILRLIGLYALTAFAGYAIASPHSFIYPQALINGLRTTWQYESGPFPDAVGRGPGLYQYGWLMLREALGTPLYWLSMAGVAFAFYRRSPEQLLVLVTIIPYFTLMTFASWVVVRYTLPVIPAFLLLAAVLAAKLGEAGRWRRPAMYAAFCGIVVWTLMSDCAFLKVQGGRNVRDVASDWIRQAVPLASTIVTVLQYAGDVYLYPVIPGGQRHYTFNLVAGSNPQSLFDRPDVEYLILNEDIYENMERLGDRHPLPETFALLQALQASRFELIAEFKLPVSVLGIDFGNNYTSQDYRIINPGIRIYRNMGNP